MTAVSDETGRVAIKPLEWQGTFIDRGDGSQDQAGWEADTGFGVWYEIEQYFGSDSYGYRVSFDYEMIGDHDDPSQAKATAQKHFEKRISAALSAAPVGEPLRRIVLDTLNAVAPAVENLSVHQEQCDRDGVMVKVSRQALDEVLNAVNEVAMQSAITTMTAFSDETGRDWLPLKYEDGPDFCTVTLATGAAFALTVHPERMKLMEAALSASPVAQKSQLLTLLDDATVTLQGLIEYPGDKDSWDEANKLLPKLLSRINFDGMDPRTFSLCELHGAIEGAEWPSLLSGAGTRPSDPSPGPDVRRRVLDILNVVAPAVENLAGHQEQCDADGVMVKVSRQALDEVLSAVNQVAFQAAITPTPIADSASDFCRHGRVIGACPFCAAGEPPAPAVGADDVIDILVDEKLASRASLVQGYLYGDDHVVRDVFRPGGEQELYRTKNAQDYTDALKRAKAEVFANAILSLLSGQGGGK